MKKVKYRAFIALSILLLFTCAVSAQTKTDTLPTLRGNKAVKHLKENGQYASLMKALKTSRKVKDQTNKPLTEDASSQTSEPLTEDAETDDVFGISVAVSGDTAVIGVYFESTAWNSNQGAAYVFVRNSTEWTEQAKLLASDAESKDFFGYSVAVSGDTAIIGAYAEDTAPNSNNGAAYVFVRSGTSWTEQAKLVASDAASFDQFGFIVAISGDTAIIGAKWKSNQDAAYIFARTGARWTQTAKLTDSGESFDQLQRRYFKQ